MMNAIYYCPKCGSEDIEVVCLNPPKPDRISIDDLANGLTTSIPAVAKRYVYRARCKKCGYEREFVQ